jgi:hypothetical protein
LIRYSSESSSSKRSSKPAGTIFRNEQAKYFESLKMEWEEIQEASDEDAERDFEWEGIEKGNYMSDNGYTARADTHVLLDAKNSNLFPFLVSS